MHKRVDFRDADPAWDQLEAGWMQQVAAGGPTAEAGFAALYRAYAALFITRLRYWGFDVDDAMDAAHDLWIELSRAAPRWPRDVPVRFYLLGFLKMARKRFFSASHHLPAVDSLTEEAVLSSAEQSLRSSAPALENEPEWLDFVRCVRRSFGAFRDEHPRLASLLLQRHVEELSLEEMTELMGGSPERAKAEVYSARRKISPTLQPCLELWPNR